MAQNYEDFVSELESRTNPDGSRKYTDTQIKEFAAQEIDAGNVDKPEIETEKEPSYFANISRFFTTDIPRTLGGMEQRGQARFMRVAEPTVMGEATREVVEKVPGRTGRLLGDIAEKGAAVPERVGRLAGAFAGTAEEMLATPFDLGIKALVRLTGHDPVKAYESIVNAVKDRISGTIPGAIVSVFDTYQNLPSDVQANIAATLDLLSIFGMIGGAQAGKKIAQPLQEYVSEKGQKWMGKQMATGTGTLKGMPGKTLLEKRTILLRNIDNYKVNSLTFTKMADKAESAAKKALDAADYILDVAAKDPLTPEVNLSALLQKGYDFAETYAPGTPKKRAKRIAQSIVEGMAEENLAGMRKIDDLVKFKKRLKDKIDIYKKGPAATPEDQMEIAIRKHIANEAIKEIERIEPIAAQLNRKARDLFDIHDAAIEAANHLIGSGKEPDVLSALAAAGGTFLALSQQNNIVRNIATPIVGLAAYGAVGGGRGPGIVMGLGRAMKTSINPRVAGLGAIAGGAPFTRIATPLSEIGQRPRTEITVPGEETREMNIYGRR